MNFLLLEEKERKILIDNYALYLWYNKKEFVWKGVKNRTGGYHSPPFGR